ncbi:sensor histidine kinase [Actinoplanes sp. N902-109]|uniref:sensor histidine kinase n=1 Tax=Actinoplanes sp. (strain N902-109) TaxID=649831 RepID=UPI00032959D0|nr:histidine kinase [Actinoplanes sp. N902-109]AGL18740.1 signal transduction histidine kinase [Actinoplanes sp. N902-109]
MATSPARRRSTPVVLNLFGLVLVGLAFARDSLGDAPPALVVVAWVTWALWAVLVALPEPRVRERAALSLLLIAGGSLVAATTSVTGLVPGVVGMLILTSMPAVPLRLVAGVVSGGVVLIGVGALVTGAAREQLISSLATLVVVSLAGLGRRQQRTAETQSRALLEERLAVEQERARVAALTERSRIARDLHDVLAHSLGGLVIQLEAVDALLEAGRSPEAQDRVQAARQLAVSGLDEARRAVSALREPEVPLSAAVAELAAAHRALGGRVTVRGDADGGVLGGASFTAVQRAVQELLTNARRHAPAMATTLDLDWRDGTLTVTGVTAAPVSAPTSSGGGHGLRGMRERVTEAGGAMSVDPGPPFRVVLTVPGRVPA